MRHQNNYIQNLHQVAARLSSKQSNQKSFLNESSYMLTQQSNLSLNQSFNSPKFMSNQQSFLITQPININMSSRNTKQNYKCYSPTIRTKTEKYENDDQKQQQQFIEATIKLLAQSEKLEKLISQQNEILQVERKDKQELEMTIKRLTQEIQFLKETHKKQDFVLENKLKQIKGKSYHLPKKLFK
ncbi:unnamed protein product [Paramecium pentaurelia]|uniref:Uncharacterized protein n=1 Tax=Paramecium pentaurelia TaxID=43138 RepID=A0A8S1SWN8_9CILI|nr:unnamed protein product [Paramecium pentaurelia]